MMQFTMSGTMLRFDETTLRFSFSRDGATWSGCDGIEPQLTRRRSLTRTPMSHAMRHPKRRKRSLSSSGFSRNSEKSFRPLVRS